MGVVPYDHPMRRSPGGEQLFWLLRARILGAGVVRPITRATIARRAAMRHSVPLAG